MNTLREAPADAKVVGTSSHEMKTVLKKFGIAVEMIEVERDYFERRVNEWHNWRYDPGDTILVTKTPTLKKFMDARDYEARQAVHLVVVTGHYVVVKGGWIADNIQGLIPFEDSRHRRKRVRFAYRLSKP